MSSAQQSHLGVPADVHEAFGPNLITKILQAQKLINRHLHAILSPLGLSYPRYEILSLLVAAPDGVIPTFQLGRALGRHPTTIVSLVDGLACSGLAVRTVNSADRRATLVSITERGRSAAQSAARALGRVSLAGPELSERLGEDLEAFLAAARRDLDTIDHGVPGQS